jgi:hypothetical protein
VSLEPNRDEFRNQAILARPPAYARLPKGHPDLDSERVLPQLERDSNRFYVMEPKGVSSEQVRGPVIVITRFGHRDHSVRSS